MDKRIFLSAFLIVSLIMLVSFVSSLPFGAEVTPGASSRANLTTDAGNHSAYAGNVTELTIFGNTISQTWQGYFGNVTGAITLSDVNNNAMYNWSIASPTGEVYASPESTLNWSSISCFNMTANLAALETAYNVPSDAADGVDETFNLNNHAGFSTATQSFALGACSNTKLYNNASVGTYDVVLLEDGDSKVVFASVLLDDETGFDGKSHDFQMIVLEDGRSDTTTTPYYFWVEIM